MKRLIGKVGLACIELAERIVATNNMHRRWGFTWRQAWRLTSPRLVIRMDAMRSGK